MKYSPVYLNFNIKYTLDVKYSLVYSNINYTNSAVNVKILFTNQSPMHLSTIMVNTKYYSLTKIYHKFKIISNYNFSIKIYHKFKILSN